MHPSDAEPFWDDEARPDGRIEHGDVDYSDFEAFLDRWYSSRQGKPLELQPWQRSLLRRIESGEELVFQMPRPRRDRHLDMLTTAGAALLGVLEGERQVVYFGGDPRLLREFESALRRLAGACRIDVARIAERITVRVAVDFGRVDDPLSHLVPHLSATRPR